MTAEIAILNKEAVALAADSAVTVRSPGGQKIFASANKIFALSKCFPVGAMVYGSAEILGVPWETVIKSYRAELKDRNFATLAEYAEDFIRYLNTEKSLFPLKVQDNHVYSAIYSYLCLIRDEIVLCVDKLLETRSLEENEISEICSDVVGRHRREWKKADPMNAGTDSLRRSVARRYRPKIRELQKNIFENLPLSAAVSRKLADTVFDLLMSFRKDMRSSGLSGLVVAGFGKKDFFPSLRSYDVEGKILHRLKYREVRSVDIGFGMTASVAPFAQSEMVATFMEGVDPNYQRAIEHDLQEILRDHLNLVLDETPGVSEKSRKIAQSRIEKLNKILVTKYRHGLGLHRNKHYVAPIIDVVSVLPKDELASMAESFVRLTSFKRRVSMQDETVAEPIDVAVISKGDGMIWVKRKHYFDVALNQHFLRNYFREHGDGSKS